MDAYAAPVHEPANDTTPDDAFRDALREFMELADRRGLDDHLVRQVLQNRYNPIGMQQQLGELNEAIAHKTAERDALPGGEERDARTAEITDLRAQRRHLHRQRQAAMRMADIASAEDAVVQWLLHCVVPEAVEVMANELGGEIGDDVRMERLGRLPLQIVINNAKRYRAANVAFVRRLGMVMVADPSLLDDVREAWVDAVLGFIDKAFKGRDLLPGPALLGTNGKDKRLLAADAYTWLTAVIVVRWALDVRGANQRAERVGHKVGATVRGLLTPFDGQSNENAARAMFDLWTEMPNDRMRAMLRLLMPETLYRNHPLGSLIDGGPWRIDDLWRRLGDLVYGNGGGNKPNNPAAAL